LNELEQKEQFQQWLLLYVSGRLGKAESAWMEEYLTKHSSAANDLKLEQTLKETLKSKLPKLAPDHGLEAFMNRVRAETNNPQNSIKAASNKNFFNRFKETINGLFIDPKWAMAVTLLLVQTGIITVLLSNSKVATLSNQAEWRSVGEQNQFKGPVLQITFKSNATEEEMRLLLVKIRATLLGGPGQLGNYFVKVQDDNLESAKQLVESSSIIESVQILPELPVEH